MSNEADNSSEGLADISAVGTEVAEVVGKMAEHFLFGGGDEHALVGRQLGHGVADELCSAVSRFPGEAALGQLEERFSFSVDFGFEQEGCAVGGWRLGAGGDPLRVGVVSRLIIIV